MERTGRLWRAPLCGWSVIRRAAHITTEAAVDVGLFRRSDGNGSPCRPVDDLSHQARHNYSGGSAQVEHRRWLLVTMRKVGLRPIGSEWWHYQLPGRRWTVLDLPHRKPEEGAMIVSPSTAPSLMR